MKAVCRRCTERTESFHFTHRGIRSPAAARTDDVSPRRHSACRRGCSNLKKRNTQAGLSSRQLRGGGGEGPGVSSRFVCNAACVRARVCVCSEQEREERESERERYEGKTDRTRGAGDSRFWTRFGDRSWPTAKTAHGKNNINKTYFVSPLPSIIFFFTV